MTLIRRNCGTGHIYRNDAGEKVPSVTTIIRNGFPAPGLINWTGKVVAEFVAHADDDQIAELRALGEGPMIAALRKLPFEQRSKAAARGTRVHKLAERLSRGEQLHYGTDIPDELEGHVESCLAFLDEWQVAPVLIEAVVGNSRVPYAGTLDLVADIPGHGRVLLDYKTGDSGIWPETALQLSAYRYADFYVGDGMEIPMREVGIENTYADGVRADEYDVKPLDTGPDRDRSVAFQTFRAAAYIAHRYEAVEALVDEALPHPREEAA